MNRLWITPFVVGLCLMAHADGAADDAAPLIDAIDPMIGSITLSGYGGHGLGKCFPGATLPFGMCQLSPDTITGGSK